MIRGAGRSGAAARALMVVASILAGITGAGCAAPEETVFSEIASPDGRWRLRMTVAEPRMPQGKFRIRGYLLAAGEDQGSRLIDTRLENDGVPFTETNIAVRWVTPTTALVCLRATDLPDRGIRIDVGPPPRATEVERC